MGESLMIRFKVICQKQKIHSPLSEAFLLRDDSLMLLIACRKLAHAGQSSFVLPQGECRRYQDDA